MGFINTVQMLLQPQFLLKLVKLFVDLEVSQTPLVILVRVGSHALRRYRARRHLRRRRRRRRAVGCRSVRPGGRG